MEEIYMNDSPVRFFRLVYSAPDEARAALDLARLALEAVFGFADGFAGLFSVDFWLACADVEFGYSLSDPLPPRPFWLVQSSHAPEGVAIRPAWENEQVLTVEEFTPAALLNALSSALDQSCNGVEISPNPVWQEMLFRATQVRLPLLPAEFQQEDMLVRSGLSSIRYPVERQGDMLWIAGPLPRKSLTAPLELRLSNEAGSFTLDISLYWSLWNETGSKGHAQLSHALDQLVDKGWQITESR